MCRQVSLHINLYVKKQHVFLLSNDDLYSIYSFQIRLILIQKLQMRNFFFFLESLNILSSISQQHFYVKSKTKVVRKKVLK